MAVSILDDLHHRRLIRLWVESGAYLFLIAVIALAALPSPQRYPKTATALMAVGLVTFFGIVFFGDRI